jgi:DNA polymerase-3 subunit alpha
MSHDTVFRAAFIVESVQVKISNKTQKKFAILAVSDGIERYELPIWAEQYEEKQQLLRENQLLFAVLQVEKKEGIRLSCRWLDDLTQVNEQMSEACDRAYDKAKQQAARFSQVKQSSTKQEKDKKPMNEKSKESPIEEKKSLFCIQMDLEKTRLSHILNIKKIFEYHRGDIPVQIEFHAKGIQVGTLHIDSRWGISSNHTLQQQINSLPAILLAEIKMVT